MGIVHSCPYLLPTSDLCTGSKLGGGLISWDSVAVEVVGLDRKRLLDVELILRVRELEVELLEDHDESQDTLLPCKRTSL